MFYFSSYISNLMKTKLSKTDKIKKGKIDGEKSKKTGVYLLKKCSNLT